MLATLQETHHDRKGPASEFDTFRDTSDIVRTVLWARFAMDHGGACVFEEIRRLHPAAVCSDKRRPVFGARFSKDHGGACVFEEIRRLHPAAVCLEKKGFFGVGHL